MRQCDMMHVVTLNVQGTAEQVLIILFFFLLRY